MVAAYPLTLTSYAFAQLDRGPATWTLAKAFVAVVALQKTGMMSMTSLFHLGMTLVQNGTCIQQSGLCFAGTWRRKWKWKCMMKFFFETVSRSSLRHSCTHRWSRTIRLEIYSAVRGLGSQWIPPLFFHGVSICCRLSACLGSLIVVAALHT